MNSAGAALTANLQRRVRPWMVLGIICISLTAITVNASLLNVALPTLARSLNASNTGLEWIVDSYALVFAALLLTAGPLGDRFGRKRTMLTGLAIFTLGSAYSATAGTTGALVAGRCVMGLGAAFVYPMTLSILTDIYSSEAGLRRAIGVWAATASAGAIIAPLIAGLLLSHFWWGSVFVVNVALSIATLVLASVTVPTSTPSREASIDWLGVLASILFSAGLVFGLIEGPERGWSDGLVLGSLLGAAVVLLAFCLHQLRSPHPLINVRFFRLPQFSIGCGVVAMQYFFSFGTSFIVTQYLQLVLGFSALKAGIALTPSAAALMLVAPYGARAFGRFGARPVITVALFLAASGTAVMNLATVGSSPVRIIVALVMVSVAIGLMAAGTTSMVMSAVPQAQAGMASGTQSATRQLGGALGVAVLGSLLAARYSAAITHNLAGSAAAHYLSSAQRSLAAALSTRATGHVHVLLVQLARSAFVDGLHLAASTAAIAAALFGVVVFIVLGRTSTMVTPTPVS
jgi:EmrB/QacA subfamily drug resistance transporter